jgi:cell division protein FtsB
MTPAEVQEQLNNLIEMRASELGEYQSEYRRADSIAKKRNALVEQIAKFNDGLSYAGKAQI